MKAMKPLLLAGLGSVAIAACAGLAHAGSPADRVLNVVLPDGGIEQIVYWGDVAPQIVLSPAMPGDVAPIAMAQPNPFAALQQISAEMDRQMSAMMNAMASGGMADPGALMPAALGQMPSGGASYSFVSSIGAGAGGACMQSLEITSMGDGQAPHVVSRSSGDCGSGQPGLTAPAGATPAALPAAPVPAQSQPRLIRVRYLMPQTPDHPSNT